MKVQDINLAAFDNYEGSGDATKAPESRVPMTNGHPEKGLYNVIAVIYKRMILWKESINSDGQQFNECRQNGKCLNSDGQQFNECQQNKPLISSHRTQKRSWDSWHMPLKI